MQNVSPYKTAAELGIQDWERDGLIELIGPLSRNELGFRMDMTDDECGTVACIGGWLAINRGISWEYNGVVNKVADYVSSHMFGALSELFYPSGWVRLSATAPQGAKAIVNFLTLGDPMWDAVMAVTKPL